MKKSSGGCAFRIAIGVALITLILIQGVSADILKDGGVMYTNDPADRIWVTVEHGNDPNAVEFVLNVSTMISWRKEIRIGARATAGGGVYYIYTQDGKREDRNGLYANELSGGSLTFKKAKMFGVMSDVLTLPLETAIAGSRITFTWECDGSSPCSDSPSPNILRDGGIIYTNDPVDLIRVTVEPGNDPNAAEFVLKVPQTIDWRKEIRIRPGDSASVFYDIFTQDSKREDHNGLYANELSGGSLTFKKAKMFGVMSDVLTLPLETAIAGSRITFKWECDRVESCQDSTLSGDLKYSINGSNHPIRNSYFEVWKSGSIAGIATFVKSGITDGNGHFDVTYDGDCDCWVTVFSRIPGVVDVFCPVQSDVNCAPPPGQSRTHHYSFPQVHVNNGENVNYGEHVLPSTYINNAAYIADIVLNASLFVQSQTGVQVSQVSVQYPCMGLCPERPYFNPYFIHDLYLNTLEKQTVTHEYGHWVMFAAYGGKWPAGVIEQLSGLYHTPGKPSVQSVAWAEGWAEFFTSAVLNQTDISNGAYENPKKDWVPGDIDEAMIAAALWDLYAPATNKSPTHFGVGFAPIFDTLLGPTHKMFRDFYDDFRNTHPESACKFYAAAFQNTINYSKPAGWVCSDVIGVPGGGAVMSGGGVAAGNIDGAGSADMVFTSVDNWDQGNDYWRIAIGTNCSAGGACTWSDPQGVDAEADVMSSTAVAAADFNGDGRLDLFLSGVDNWDQGNDYWRYRIGTNCNANGACTWSPIQGLEAGADVMSGGSVAVGQFDADPRPDVVITGIDNWGGGNDYWRYRIGMNCDAQGNCTWSPIQQLEAGADVMSGGGVTVGDLDNNGIQEIVIFGIDNWGGGNDYWRYRIGTNCNSDGACTWSPIQGLEAGADVMSGGGVSLANITVDTRPDIIVTGIDNWGGLDYWRYRVGTNCNVATGECTWGQVSTVDSGGDVLVGGGLTLFDLDANGEPELVLEGIDTWGGLDYWRYRIGFTQTCTQIPTPMLKSITVSPATASVLVGGTNSFISYPKDQFGNPMKVTVTWSSSDTNVGTIDSNGLFTAKASGTTTITASSGKVSGTATAAVTVPPPVLTTITVSPATASVLVGGTNSFISYPKDQFGNPMKVTVTWSSSDTNVGTIDSNGLFTAKASGTTTITAASGTVSGTATAAVTVPPPVLTTITVSPTTASVMLGFTQLFSSDPRDQYGDPIAVTVTWSSSDTNLGTIDSNGLFTAKNSGTTTITAASGKVSGTAIVFTYNPLN